MKLANYLKLPSPIMDYNSRKEWIFDFNLQHIDSQNEEKLISTDQGKTYAELLTVWDGCDNSWRYFSEKFTDNNFNDTFWKSTKKTSYAPVRITESYHNQTPGYREPRIITNNNFLSNQSTYRNYGEFFQDLKNDSTISQTNFEDSQVLPVNDAEVYCNYTSSSLYQDSNKNQALKTSSSGDLTDSLQK